MEEISLIDRIRGLSLAERFAKLGVKFAVVYGSVARRRETSVSDIDIAVYCDDDDFLRLASSFGCGLFGREVDLVNLRSLSSFDCYEILSGGELIFASPGDGEDLYRRTKLKAMIGYLDFEFVRRQVLRDMRNRIENGTYGRSAAETERA